MKENISIFSPAASYQRPVISEEAMAKCISVSVMHLKEIMAYCYQPQCVYHGRSENRNENNNEMTMSKLKEIWRERKWRK